MFSRWLSTTSRDWLRPLLFFRSSLDFMLDTPYKGFGTRETGFRLNRAFHHPIAYRP
jgi:hypothetical protein